MEIKNVRLIEPISKNNHRRELICKIEGDNKNIYECVEEAVDKIKRGQHTYVIRMATTILIGDIINLHNVEGIENAKRIINSIFKDINFGKDISDKHNLPNIKIVKSVDDKFVLFDGHHTILAYMMSGKKFLNEIPHLIVENSNGFVSDEEIKIFYGVHAREIKKSDWFKFVINWQLLGTDQLQRRVQNNIDELYNALIKKMKK